MRKSEGMADTPDAIPAFATAARSAILAPMPPLEINATQPWLIAPDGNVLESTRRFDFVLANPTLRDWYGQLTLGLIRTGGVE